jgi:transcriptional regulator with XRE-family HTH domain
MSNVHIGRLIENRRSEVGMTKSELARRLNMRSQSLTHIINSPSINTQLLQRISEALNYDFFQHYVSVKELSAGSAPAIMQHPQRGISIMIHIDDEAKQERVLKLLGITLK